MKRIFSIILVAFAAMSLFSCAEKVDNDAYSDWLGEHYNQEILWNVDSLAFYRATWTKTELKQGAVLNTAKIKMTEMGAVQSVSYITYTSNSFFTRVGAPESGTAKISESVGEDVVFAMNGGPAYAKINGVEKNTTASKLGLGITEHGANGSEDIIADGDLTAYNSALAGVAVLVKDGEEQTFASSADNDTRMARSIYGVTKDGKYTMAVIGGGVAGEADGCTMAEAAFIARVMGLVNAVALSNGDQASLYVSGEGTVNGSDAALSNYIYVEAIELFAGGEGTKASPYLISNNEELNNMHLAISDDKTVYFQLAADIDMTGMEWEPLNYSGTFKKAIVFDGNGHTISNFYCNFATYPSFFGVLNGECRNVKFENATVVSGGKSAGVIGGYVGSTSAGVTGLVENCYVQGTVTMNGGREAAGIAGTLDNGSQVVNCYVDVEVTGNYSGSRNYGLATIAGEIIASDVDNCFGAGKINGNDMFNVGGLVGRANNAGVANVRNNISWVSEVIGRTAAGAVIGRWNYKKIDATSVQEGNYSRSDANVVTYKNYGDKTEVAIYGGGELSGGNDYAVTGTQTSDPVKAAKDLGWDEKVWDLSGETPQLVLFK